MTHIFLVLIFLSNLVSGQQLQWMKLRKYKVNDLEPKISESSGLTFWGERLFTFNDSGNSPVLYELNPYDGNIIDELKIKEIVNFDWEALTNDNQFFYIADIGNNWGTRKDLKIYKVRSSDGQHTETIRFHYPEQDIFIKKNQSNNWDAESLVCINDSLHLFTKEWQSQNTSHYIIPKNAADTSIPATKLETYHLGYVATDACFYNDRLYILGYTKKMELYLTVFLKDEKGFFFTGSVQKYYLGMAYTLGQLEGIAANKKGLYISGETFNLYPIQISQKFYFIPWEVLEK